MCTYALLQAFRYAFHALPFLSQHSIIVQLQSTTSTANFDKQVVKGLWGVAEAKAMYYRTSSVVGGTGALAVVVVGRIVVKKSTL